MADAPTTPSLLELAADQFGQDTACRGEVIQSAGKGRPGQIVENAQEAWGSFEATDSHGSAQICMLRRG